MGGVRIEILPVGLAPVALHHDNSLVLRLVHGSVAMLSRARRGAAEASWPSPAAPPATSSRPAINAASRQPTSSTDAFLRAARRRHVVFLSAAPQPFGSLTSRSARAPSAPRPGAPDPAQSRHRDGHTVQLRQAVPVGLAAACIGCSRPGARRSVVESQRGEAVQVRESPIIAARRPVLRRADPVPAQPVQVKRHLSARWGRGRACRSAPRRGSPAPPSSRDPRRAESFSVPSTCTAWRRARRPGQIHPLLRPVNEASKSAFDGASSISSYRSRSPLG